MKKIILLALVGLTLLPFLHPGLFYVHDPTSAFRLYTLIETLKLGQFPAAWSNLLNFGFGYPLHLYYAPLFTYLGTIFAPTITSYEIAVKSALALSSLIGAVGVYKLIRSHAGSTSSLLGAIAFIFLPYRASAIYVRGSYSEFLAMSLLPWVILYWQKPQNSRKTIAITSIVTGLFILSHNTMPLLVAPIILLLILLYQRKNLLGSFLSLSLGAGLVNWFILPIIFERGFVQVELIAVTTNYRDHFLYLSQLWSSPWGYGGSGKGIGGDSMSFMIGKGQLILAMLGSCYLLLKREFKQFIIYVGIVAGAIFLSLESSSFIWEKLSVLQLIQFPWRSLALIGVGVAVLSGYSLTLLPKSYRTGATVILAALLILTNFRYFKPQEYRTYSKETLGSLEYLDPLARNQIPEYLPKWMNNTLYRRDDGFSRNSVSTYGNFNLTEPKKLVVNTAYMPQWKMLIDEKETAITPTYEGLITSQGEIEPGNHYLKLIWQRTAIEKIGILVSVVSILAVIGLTLI